MITMGVRREADFITARIEADVRGKIGKATVRALNRAIDTAQTIANRKIRERYNVKAAAVRKAFKKKRAHGKQSYAVAELEISGVRIPLIEFGASWSRKMRPGASVRVLKGGSRKRIAGAFIGVHGATGTRQVFVRFGKAPHEIRSLRSISVPQQFTHKAVLTAVQEATREAFSKNFAQQLKFLSGA
jgi:hypothetical protein